MVTVLDYPFITQPGYPGPKPTNEVPDNTVRKQNLATQTATNLATQPENDPHQIWRVGSTRWTEDHLHRKSAIDGAPPQIGFPPHQILSLHHSISQNSGLEAQNRLEATSHQNWRQMAPLPNWLPLTLQDLFPTTTSWANPLRLVQLTTW